MWNTLNSFARPGRAATSKLLHKINLWSNFQTAARPGFTTEFKNISHKCYLAIVLTCLQVLGDSKKLGMSNFRAKYKHCDPELVLVQNLLNSNCVKLVRVNLRGEKSRKFWILDILYIRKIVFRFCSNAVPNNQFSI